MTDRLSYEVVVVGAGPAGQRGAIAAARAGARTLLIERAPRVGGECVFRSTVPSKTLLASARSLRELHRSWLENTSDGQGAKVPLLMDRVKAVCEGYSERIQAEISAAGVERMQAQARFTGPHSLLAESLDGKSQAIEAKIILIATGTRPRRPFGMPVDHDRILDSDSILSLAYLPSTLLVVGAGVIGSEFASLFQALGVQVTMVDSRSRPMNFLEPGMSIAFERTFRSEGGLFIPGVTVKSMELGTAEGVDTQLSNGESFHTTKVLVAQGRVAGLQGLGLSKLGLEPNARGLIDVDEFGRTEQNHIYAAGDVTGPPALAAASMHQGQRAIRHALGLDPGLPMEGIPTGIYTLPELASVGLTEAQTRERFGGALVGTTSFEDLARARIDGTTEGLLHIVCEPQGKRIVGVHIIADRASELIHLGQMAVLAGYGPEFFEQTIFNFPTYAQAYAQAARKVLARRGSGTAQRAA